ncbi:hypothetical protein NHQ30_003948 [Ciborinia camelliae]|nr:hypothetical protein NHQ30_003948 [Ciborinia camelliae]
MQLTTLITLTLSVFSTVTVADNCYEGFKYCGKDLLSVAPGKYHDTVVQALISAGMPYDQEHMDNTLFDCGDAGWIEHPVYCANGCTNAGKGSHNNDFCA